MDFREDLIKDVKVKEEMFDVSGLSALLSRIHYSRIGSCAGIRTTLKSSQNFFSNVKARLNQTARLGPSADGEHHFDQAEKDMISQLHDAQTSFRSALCDSFNTPLAIQVLVNLVGEVNMYIAKPSYNPSVLEPIAEWVTRMLRIFGLGEGGAE